MAASRYGVGNKWVRIHVPRVAQLAHISSPTLGSVEAAQGESHSFRNRRGHGSLPTRAIILSKGGISARCYYERGERYENMSHYSLRVVPTRTANRVLISNAECPN